MTTSRKTTPAPPPAAVAADPHWAATRERLAHRNRPTATLTICDDDGLKNRLRAARLADQSATARLTERPDDKTLQTEAGTARRELDAATAGFDQAAIVLHFRALPRPDFEALKEAHPPTEEQADDGAAFNAEAFAPDLIAAASLDGITPDDATTYMTTWAEGEAVALYRAAWDIQSHTRMDLDLGKG